MTQNELLELVTDFSQGLLKKAKVTHAGNCLLMSEILKEYLSLFGISTLLINVKVREVSKKINHYCLIMENGDIVDATASQFNNMPIVYIGELPANYLKVKYLQ